MPGRLRPWSLLRSVKSEIEWTGFWCLLWWKCGSKSICGHQGCFWGAWVFGGPVAPQMPESGSDLGSTSGQQGDRCPRTWCLGLPGLPLPSASLNWVEMGLVWRGSSFCHLGACPALGWGLAEGDHTIVGEKPESSLRNIWGLNQLCLWKNLPILDLSVEAIREITGPFLIPDSVQCLFRKIENSRLEQGDIWAHTESCCLRGMPLDNLPFSEV